MQKPALAPDKQPTVESFLQAVLRSGLLERDQLQKLLAAAPPERRGDAATLANYLVKAGVLSRFQAKKLLAGVTRGLTLGPYQVLAPLGKGGMSAVYLGRDSRSQQLVALKVLPPKRARAEERLLPRFLREMELCRRVAHAHLAWTYDVGVCQGVYYIAMEFIPGKSLYRLVGEQGPLAVPRAARLFAEVSLALEHAHEQGLIHRDMKPSNILVTPHDHAKVLDLGLALIQGEAVSDRELVGGQGYVLGTMDYIAPEQADDSTKVDPRSDIYGLGCTLYFALAGRPPFPGGTALEKIQRHRTEEPAPITQLRPQVPAEFAALLGKMMAKKPEDRFASAGAVREKLLAWTTGEPALPLDSEGEAIFQQAMATLEAEVPDSEVTAELLPIPETDPAGSAALAPVSVPAAPTERTPSDSRPPWQRYLLPLALSALIGLFLVVLLCLLKR